MKKILVIATGGTIATVKDNHLHLENPLKIMDYIEYKDVVFECVSPFSVLSENMNIDLWNQLIEYIGQIDFDQYDGLIVLHGSDTLAYTGAILGNIFYDKKIILVASDKPVEDKSSNAIPNFRTAVDFLLDGVTGVYLSYDKLFRAETTNSANENDVFFTSGKPSTPLPNPVLKKKNILVINPYVGIDYNNYNLDTVDAVLHSMYHSATAPENVLAFIQKCKDKKIPFYFVTTKSSVEYESAKDFENIIFNSTIENAYARLLLT